MAVSERFRARLASLPLTMSKRAMSYLWNEFKIENRKKKTYDKIDRAATVGRNKGARGFVQ